MSAQLQRSSHEQTLVLTLSNPGNRNALDPGVYAQGLQALRDTESCAEVRSVVLVGAGDTFCAGGSLRRLLANRAEPPSVQRQSVLALHSWIEGLRNFPKPVIAAVEGAAAGAGFSLALACDFIVAADNAVFALSYSNVALSPDGGSSWHLARALPRQLANEMLMCGERMTAQRLFELGLVNRVCAPGLALAQALALAQTLNQRAPNCLSSIKSLLNAAPGNTLAAQLEQESHHFVQNLHHDNAGQGIEAFLNKITPRY